MNIKSVDFVYSHLGKDAAGKKNANFNALSCIFRLINLKIKLFLFDNSSIPSPDRTDNVPVKIWLKITDQYSNKQNEISAEMYNRT